jgi:thioesterase domain-containing protein
MTTAVELAPQVADDVQAVRSGGSHGSSVVRVKRGADGVPPLFCVPGLGGSALVLNGMAAALPDGITLYGFEAASHRGLPSPKSLTAMAEAYVDDLIAFLDVDGERGGPFVLAGYSFGGVVAFEMARVLLERGHPAARLILIDPNLVRPGLWRRRLSAGRKRARRPLHRGQTRKQRNAGRIDRVASLHTRLAGRHRPSVFHGSIVLVSSASRRRRMGDDLLGLQSLVDGTIEAHALPGHHLELIRGEHVPGVSAVMADVVERVAVEHERRELS